MSKTTKPMNETDSALAEQYQQKTDKQHILDNPDTYIGSVENVDSSLWVYNDQTNRIEWRDIEYIPGLYKLFDEGIVNCRDHVVRMIQSNILEKRFVSYIDTTIDADGMITMSNDGNGIDVAKHPEYNIWIPEMVFGHLRTSTNYNKNEKRIVGGKNGFGFKLVLIWSTYGRVETVDHIRGLKYVQEFHNNLDQIDPPKITKTTSMKPYTKVSFKPDYKRLGIENLTSDMIALLRKRIYDIGAVTDHSVKKVKISYNDTIIPVKNFQQYIEMYIGPKDQAKRAYENPDERWEYAVALSPTHEYMQVSFVNGICTFKGGKHVDYITGQIVRKLCDYIEKKKKVKVNGNAIKEQLLLFLRCDIENPSFDSQTKDYMNTPSAKFGSTCSVSDNLIEKIAKMGVMDAACSITEAKESKLAKKTDGSKTRNVRGIANLVDANLSGTANSKDCILILCEGLSALSGIVSGLSSDDRNTIGIYPLKGKLLNVRGEQLKKISENKEINEIKKILGLESGKEYNSIEEVHKNLRYGKIMYMTDQDLDGSHIKGLCINMFHSEWASLTRIPGFLSFMNTPILRAKKGAQLKLFYNDGEYNDWKESLGQDGSKGWNVKYFKGLGTSTSAEFKQYFANKKVVDFVYNGKSSDDIIDKIFNKKRADDRKVWLENYDKNAYLDTSQSSVQYEQFINNEMIHFSTYDCARSIPNMVDGLKISLRKILFAAFKRKLTTEIKVAQFSGYVSEHSAYHHGEASLNGAIVNMAQNYVGSNNVNLLQPNGQFGTRLHGGDDSASERYIFTQLNSLTRYIFPDVDDAVLNYLNDDGTLVEPEYYVPIIPFALMNGISGIGTGFSCNIAPYNPKQIILYLQDKLKNRPTDEYDFIPYYEGFNGTVRRVEDNKFLIKGCYEKVGDDKIRITELPVGTWTMPYNSYLETLVDGIVDNKTGKRGTSLLKDFSSVCTEVSIDIQIVFPRGKLADLENATDATGCNGVEKLLKLQSSLSTTNMHMFDKDCKLHKYRSVQEIIDEFYGVRIDVYQKRKAAQLTEMEHRLVRLSNRAKYIQETLVGTVDLRRMKTDTVNELLSGKKYDKIDGDYKYLVKMPMDSVTDENVANIMAEKATTEADIETLRKTSVETIWYRELTKLSTEYDKYKLIREKIQLGGGEKKKVIKKMKITKKK
jgi:DNA topoisomerase-2